MSTDVIAIGRIRSCDDIHIHTNAFTPITLLHLSINLRITCHINDTRMTYYVLEE